MFADGAELGRHVIDIGKGHAEHLMAVIEAALASASTSFADIGRIGIAVGPGSFTGIRVGVATARGLALALKVPAIGISNLEAVAWEAASRHRGRKIMAAFASAQGAVQAALYDPLGKLVYDPSIMTADQAARIATDHDALVTGSAAPSIAVLHDALEVDGVAVTADISTYALLAENASPAHRPRPLYLREPDAKPQAGFVVARVTS